ncbi:Outer dense fiber protein 3 [Lamellibrachia satsuma]|nr:Outer dense fiber protein 3 [Lamellibrachia satsuma]
MEERVYLHGSLVPNRPQDLKSFKTPGPGAHSPEAAGPSASPRAPSYSFGSRSKYRSIDKNPAPNTYSLPTLTGRTVEGNKRQAPMPSVRGRSNVGSFSEDLQKTPGPGAYAQADPNVYKGRAPLYTLRPRVVMPGDSTLKPGPGAHSPERVVITKHQAPQFSFGNKHSEYLTPLIVDVEE